ncbi:MAG: DUF4199 domain-containing protein [Hymenobacter sp.]|nr:MAG: DUF4199 domain-containing protein [Hymenobacter sp.]
MQPSTLTSNAGPTFPSSAALIIRLGLRFGVGAGIICAAWLLFLQLSGNNAFGPKQLMGQLLVPLSVAGSQWLLRRMLAPQRPGVGRALAVGWLTAIIAAVIAGTSVWGLANGVGEATLAKNRTEMLEIVRVQQEVRDKQKRNAQFEAQELKQIAELSKGDLALGTFTRVLLMGVLLAVPSGLFLRK